MSDLVLAFDYGLRRIGVAVGNRVTGTARALAPLAARDGAPRWEQVENLIAEWRPALLLIGLPLNMDGTPSDMSARAERFARRLHGRFGLRCELMDERLSSFEARGLLAAERSPASTDSVAACLILESWLAARAGADGAD
jgi:putative Holliday junction resolvase